MVPADVLNNEEVKRPSIDDVPNNREARELASNHDRPKTFFDGPYIAKIQDSATKAVDIHMEIYNELLQSYTKGLDDDLKFKKEHKEHLYDTCIIIMAIVVLSLFLSVVLGNNTVEGCALVVIPFLTTFIVIPKTITSYLFNSKDSESVSKMVEAIRQHDEKLLEMAKDGGNKAISDKMQQHGENLA